MPVFHYQRESETHQVLVLSQVLTDGLKSNRESEFPPTISGQSVGAISESRSIEVSVSKQLKENINANSIVNIKNLVLVAAAFGRS